jgi:hypothetical protein
LTDPIGATAEYHYLLAVAKGGFVFVSVNESDFQSERTINKAKGQTDLHTCRTPSRFGPLRIIWIAS